MWLLLLPAMALLFLFTHYPAAANLWHSFYSTPRGNRAAVFAGWRDMNDYMRENKIEPVPPQLAAQATPTKGAAADTR